MDLHQTRPAGTYDHRIYIRPVKFRDIFQHEIMSLLTPPVADDSGRGYYQIRSIIDVIDPDGTELIIINKIFNNHPNRNFFL